MGRPKSQEKKNPLSSSKDEAGSGYENSVSSQKKRGRPRKFVKDDMEGEDLKESAFLNEEEQDNSVEVGKKGKRQKKFGDAAGPSIDKNSDANGVILEGHSKPVFAKRAGNRRKGRPTRAAGAFFHGK